MKILLRMPNWLGDGVMTTPIFEVLKKQYPQASFIIVGSPVVCALYQNDSRVCMFFIDESKKAKNRLYAIYQLGKKIASLGDIDIAITFANHFYSALLLYFSSARIKIGYAGFGRSFLLDHCIPKKKCDHQVLSYAALLNPLNFSYELGHLKLPFSIQKSHHRFPHIGISTGGAFGVSKIWLVEYFAEVMIYFLNQEYRVFLFGSGAEVKNNQKIIQIIQQTLGEIPQNLIDLSNQTSIEDLILKIGDLDLFLSNDSGPMHIAAAMHTPLIALFGATHPSYCLPWQFDNICIINKSLPCAPCQKRICPLKHHNCMKSILPQDVIEASKKMLGVEDAV